MTLDPTLVERLTTGESLANPVGSYVAPDCEVADAVIAGVPVRTYAAGRDRILVWIHGGGFMAGDLDMPEADVVAREIAHRADVTVVSIGYSLAPFPAALDEVVAVVAATAAAGRPTTIGGTSAGGNLALAAALRLRDAGSAQLDAIVLCYPYLHVINPELSDDLENRMLPLPEQVRFTPAKVRSMVEHYLGDAADAPPARAYPGDDPDLGALPVTLVIGAEYDDLLSSARAGADALKAAGVDVIEYLERGVMHGHLNTPGLPGALRTIDRIARFVQRDESA
ncbi:MAG: alpha/beta hydrolase [Glaciihabitans sp.]|nr:alpha/beta hydrolase [Glaciihabitans sp.]